MGLTKNEILGFDDRAIESLKVPEWGDGEVYLRVLSGEERDSFELACSKASNPDGSVDLSRLSNLRARMAALSLCDVEGKRLFSSQDVTALGKKSASALSRIWDKATQMNGMTKEDVEELAKN